MTPEQSERIATKLYLAKRESWLERHKVDLFLAMFVLLGVVGGLAMASVVTTEFNNSIHDALFEVSQ